MEESKYENGNAIYNDPSLASVSEDIMMSLAQSMPKDEYHNLMQKVPPASIDMMNKKTLGFEGSLWFGNPSQKMQVIFDTGSSVAWLFSEECQAPHCPIKNKKFM